MKKVSILVPYYNSLKTINRCVDSIINQSYKNIEIILVNDGSTDGDYFFHDPRIKSISFKKNKGVSAARNVGLEYATGDYIMFVDADDSLEKEAVKTMMNNCSGFTLCKFNKIEDEEIIEHPHQFNPNMKEYLRGYLLNPSNHPISYCWGKLYKRSIIEKNKVIFNEKLHFFEDVVFNMDYLKYVKKIKYINEKLYNFITDTTKPTVKTILIEHSNYPYAMKKFRRVFRDFKEVDYALTHYSIISLIMFCKTNKNLDPAKRFIETNIFKDCFINYLCQKAIMRYGYPKK